MQDAQRAIPFFCFGHRIAIAAMVSVLLAGSICAQDLRKLTECENLLSVAVKAEQQKDFIEAELRYEECRNLARTHRLPKMEAGALHRLAVMRARNRKFSDSANLFRDALKLDPHNALILCDFAQLHADRKDYTEAEKLLKEALDADPNNPKILFHLGTVIASQRAERQTEGLRYLKLAVGESEAYRELAKIYRSQGDVSRAEFADQKAKEAGNKAPSGTQADSLTGTNHLRQSPTPPEVIERNRQEIIDSKTREIIGSQQQQPNTPITQIPFIPAPVSPTPGRTTNLPETTVGEPAPAITPLPIDPFAAMVRLQEPATSPVRRLEPPSAVPAVAQTSVRALPNYSDTLPVIPPAVQNSIPDPFAPIQTVELETLTQKQNSPEPSLVNVFRPDETSVNTSQPLHSPVSNAPKMNSPSIRVLPTIPGLSSGVKPAERKDKENKSDKPVGNPLRTIHFGDTSSPDSSANVSILASLPSYTAVGGKRVARFDQNITQRNPDADSKETELRQSPQQSATIVRSPRSLPTTDVDVLQSPTTMTVQHDVPRTRTQSSSRESDTKQSVAATQESGYAKIIQSDRRFSSANSPEVLGFGLAKNDQVPPEKPVVLAVRPLAENDSSQVTRSVVRLPQVESKVLNDDSDRPKTEVANPAHTVLTVVPSDSFPLESPTTSADMQKPARVAVVPTDPFPLVVNNAPRFTEVRNIELKTSEPSHEPQIAVAPVRPMPAIENTVQPPKFTEVKNIETRIRSLPESATIVPVPADPFSVVANDPAKFAEVKRSEPQTPGATKPAPITALPAGPFAVTTNPLPMFTEAKKAELPKQTAVTTLPVNQSPVMNPPPVLAEAKKTEPLPRVSPAPVREEPAGFASSRRTGHRMAASDDQQTGFARSRK